MQSAVEHEVANRAQNHTTVISLEYAAGLPSHSNLVLGNLFKSATM